MVYFTCDGCNETLKKNQVDSHAYRCRQCESVSCVDCYVSFYGDDYRAHTTCITEAQKYEGKAANDRRSTKRSPQQEWMDTVHYCANNTAPQSLRHHFQTMCQLDNIPRKEKQFRNFTANSLKLRGPQGDRIVSEIWNVLNAERQKRMTQKKKEDEVKAEAARAAKAAKQASSKRQSDDDDDDDSDSDSDDESAKKKKKKSEANAAEESRRRAEEEKKRKTESSNDKLDAKQVLKAAKKELKKVPSRSMKVKALRKTLLKRMSLPKTMKKELKRVLRNAPKKTKLVMMDGKMIALKD
mmetsp:Transcript_512/g.1443  ORF Transcript_512/g.1443 Transcript_512/m.1443 type:complete len:297 (-) Transcript_512:817-1707(-)